MYIVFAIGALHLMRWMMCAANCLVSARALRPGVRAARFQGTQQFR